MAEHDGRPRDDDPKRRVAEPRSKSLATRGDVSESRRHGAAKSLDVHANPGDATRRVTAKSDASRGLDQRRDPVTTTHGDVDLAAKSPAPQALRRTSTPNYGIDARRGRPKGRRQRPLIVEPPGYVELSDHHREEAIAALATLLRPLLTRNERPQRTAETKDEQ